MRSGRASAIGTIFGAVAVLACAHAQGQVSFTGLGNLGGGTSKAYSISSDGLVVVGDSLDTTGKTQAFIWTTTQGIRGIGFLNSTYKDSHGRGVGVDAAGTIHVAGYSQNASNKVQAVHWWGNNLGVGSYLGLPFLPDGDESRALGMRINSTTDEVYIVGEAEKAHGAQWHGFRWRSNGSGSLDLQDIIDGNSDAWDIGWRPNGTQVIVGTSNSNWWVSGTGNRREGYRYTPTDYMVGTKGLDYVCGRGFQVAAGDNGLAETAAKSGDLQIKTIGTTGLSRGEVIVSSGYDNWLQTAHQGNQVAPGDLLWPEALDADGTSESVFRATSPDGRFHVGRCTYPDSSCGATHPQIRLFRANLYDSKVKDGESTDHCGGNVMHFPLGSLGDDNYSEAYDVSNPASPEPSREGLVAVGWSMHAGYRILAGANGVAESTALCDDVQEVPVGTTGLSSSTVVVSPGPNGLLDSAWAGDDTYQSYGINGSTKRAFVCFVHDSYDLFVIQTEMYDLKAYLESQGLDLSGWQLTEARGVSSDGTVITGLGVHNGQEEGWIASVGGLAFIGACCLEDLTCQDDSNPSECLSLGGRFQGGGTTCSTSVCCPYPYADADLDDDVDQSDFGALQACYTGMGGGVPAGCECFDRNRDGNINGSDFESFGNCWTGPNVPWTQALTPDCVP